MLERYSHMWTGRLRVIGMTGYFVLAAAALAVLVR
jgi:hypothetical protein